jgi:hypothetical protein
MDATKKCLMCAEQIPADAVFCPYCGTRFGEEVQAAPPPAEPVPPAPVLTAPLPAKKNQTGLWIAGALVLVILCGAIGTLLWTQRANLPLLSGLLATPTPTATSTLPPTLTPTITLTSTPQPTATATPVPAWVTDFAQPILVAVAGRNPDFTDDFSEGNQGWICRSAGLNPDGLRDGVMRLDETLSKYCSNGAFKIIKDFILEVDVRLVKGDTDSNLMIFIHNRSSQAFFHIGINSVNNEWGWGKIWIGGNLNDVYAGNVSPPGEWTHIVVIARGSQIAIQVNGTPVAYYDDPDFVMRDNAFSNFLYCGGNAPTLCEFDNVKFWDLSWVPNLP